MKNEAVIQGCELVAFNVLYLMKQDVAKDLNEKLLLENYDSI